MLKIIRLTNRDPRFYPMLGPFLARRDVEKEIGYKVYDDDGKEWLIAVDDGQVAGFCYLWPRPKGRYQIGSCYVKEESRRKGVFGKLLKEALSGVKGAVTLTTKNPTLKATLLKEGFAELRARGAFTEYVKEA